MRFHRLHALTLAAVSCGGLAAGQAHGLVIEDFESYAVDTFPSAWTDVQNAQTTSPRVRNDGNSISGNYLEFSSPYYGDNGNAYESITLELPVTFQNDGDYIQVAAMLPSSSPDVVGGWLLLLAGPYTGINSVPGAIGLESVGDQFMSSGPVDSLGNGTDFGTVAMDTWYYLRATLRDSNTNGLLDSYDFQIFSDAAGTTLVDEKLGVAFPLAAGEGPISYIALKTYPQSGAPHGVVFFDEITTNVEIPEPASLGLLVLALPCVLRRRAR